LTAAETIEVVGAHQNLNDTHDLTTPLSGMVCHLWASTCYRQPTHHISSLCLHSLWRYERWYIVSKMGWLGSLKVTGN